MPKKAARRRSSKPKKSPRKAHTLHKPHIHLSFSASVLIVFISLSVMLLLLKPVSYDGLQYASANNGGFYLQVPSAMTQVQAGDDAISYEHRANGPASGLLSHVRVESQASSKQEINQKKQIITKQLLEQQGPYYQSFTGDSKRSEVAGSIQFAGFKKIPTKLGDGLASDFSYRSNDQQVKGRLVVMFGSEKIYVLSTEAVSDVWDNNQSTWNSVISSFGI